LRYRRQWFGWEWYVFVDKAMMNYRSFVHGSQSFLAV
jgi:hypothetical protein